MALYITYPHVGCSLAATGLSSGVAALPLFAKHPARRIDLAPTPRAERPAEPRTLRRKTPVGRLCRRGTGHARRPAHGRDHVQARRLTAGTARTPDTGERHEPLRAFRG